MDVKNTHSVTKTEISVFGRQALGAERRRSPSLADKVLIANNKNEEKILFPAQGLNRDRRIPLCRAYYVFALTVIHSATPVEWITRVVYLPQSGETTTAERDDFHSKSLVLVKK